MKKIQGYDNYSITENGLVINTRTNLERKPDFNKSVGYLQISLYSQNIRKTFYIHRLVAITYIPNVYNLPEVNHKDSNRLHNHVSNLEWVSSSGNSIHAVLSGQRDHVARMSKKEISNAFDLVMLGNSYKEVSELLNNSWQSGYLSVKVAEFAKSVGKLESLKEQLYKQRVVRSLKNLESVNK